MKKWAAVFFQSPTCLGVSSTAKNASLAPQGKQFRASAHEVSHLNVHVQSCPTTFLLICPKGNSAPKPRGPLDSQHLPSPRHTPSPSHPGPTEPDPSPSDALCAHVRRRLQQGLDAWPPRDAQLHGTQQSTAAVGVTGIGLANAKGLSR